MPNHVQNNIHFDCSEERLKEILTTIQFDEERGTEVYGIGTFDFNKVIAMHKDLLIEDGSRTADGIELYLSSINPNNSQYGMEKATPEVFNELFRKCNNEKFFRKYNPNLTKSEAMKLACFVTEEELLEIGKQAINNMKNFGATTWYEWRIKNWGTKWNSYSNHLFENQLSFQTAWSAPHPIVARLSEMFPDVKMKHEWADEDLGHNLGYKVYKGGEILETDQLATRAEMFEYAVEVWGIDMESIGMVKNAKGDNYINIKNETYDLIHIEGQSALFTNERLTESDIPKGLFVAYLRQANNENAFASLESEVIVDLAGSVVTRKPIDFGESGIIELTQENMPNFIGEEYTFAEFMEKNLEQEGEMKID